MLELAMTTSSHIISDLKVFFNPVKAKFFLRFFKTGKGEYGEGDIFNGITVPDIRRVAKKHYQEVPLQEVKKLIENPIHEVRLCGYIILTYKFEKADDKEKKDIYSFYMNNPSGANNWDIVDLSCYKIVGEYLVLHPQERSVLYELVRSEDLWEQRISIISTLAFVKRKDLVDALRLSKVLLVHEHDLIHKAVGWVLREVGKKDIQVLREFLNANVKNMSRTTLRYAIERMDESERKVYLSM